MKTVVKTFKPEFVERVRGGEKSQTIRQFPKRGLPEVGDLFSARQWTARPYHSKQITIIESHVIAVQTFHICREGWFYIGDEPTLFTKLDASQSDILATQDGFTAQDSQPAHEQMLTFFKKNYKLPFKGILIKWRPPKQSQHKASA